MNPGFCLHLDASVEDHLLNLVEAGVEQPGGEQVRDGVTVNIHILVIILILEVLGHDGDFTDHKTMFSLFSC